MSLYLVEPSVDRAAGLEEESKLLHAESERLRGMLGLPAGVPPKPDLVTARLFPGDDPLPKMHGHSPAQEKIAPYRALFRGREDVYARYWCDERSGTKGQGSGLSQLAEVFEMASPLVTGDRFRQNRAHARFMGN